MNVRLLLGINVYLLGIADVSYSLRLNGCNALDDFLLRLGGTGLKSAMRTKIVRKCFGCNKMLHQGF